MSKLFHVKPLRTANRGLRKVGTQDHLYMIAWFLTFFDAAEDRAFWRILAQRTGFSRTYCRSVCRSSIVNDKVAKNWIICREALKLKEEYCRDWESRQTPEAKKRRALEQQIEIQRVATEEIARLRAELEDVAA